MGAWLFRYRGVIPVPLLIVLVLVATPSITTMLAGTLLILLGELVRFWGVAHIGGRSRTRTAQVGDLVQSGPFRISRNPLYVGNMLLFVGVATWSGHWILVGLTLALLAIHYSLIIRWEEGLLHKSHGQAFAQYCRQTHRWLGRPGPQQGQKPDWLEALRSERSTLMAIGLTTLALGLQT